MYRYTGVIESKSKNHLINNQIIIFLISYVFIDHCCWLGVYIGFSCLLFSTTLFFNLAFFFALVFHFMITFLWEPRQCHPVQNSNNRILFQSKVYTFGYIIIVVVIISIYNTSLWDPVIRKY